MNLFGDIRTNPLLMALMIIVISAVIGALVFLLIGPLVEQSMRATSKLADEASRYALIQTFKSLFLGFFCASAAFTLLVTLLEYGGKGRSEERPIYKWVAIISSSLLAAICLILVLNTVIVTLANGIQNYKIVAPGNFYAVIALVLMAFVAHVMAIIFLYAPYTRHFAAFTVKIKKDGRTRNA